MLSTIDPASMKVADLKEELEKRGVSTKGLRLKADLVKKLKEVLDGTEEAEEMEVEKKIPAKRGRAASKKATKEEVEEEEEEEEEEKPAPKKKGKASKQEVKEEEEEEEEEAPVTSGKKKAYKAKIDQYCGLSGEVYSNATETFDAMLNQTNIGQNNNKYYVIQLIKNGGSYSVFTRWGRVGERGQSATKACGSSLDAALKEFKKKFKEKTGNNWDERDNFVKKNQKYDLVDMDTGDADEDEEEAINAKLAEKGHKLEKGGKKESKVKACSLPEATQKLIKLIYDNDMFKEALASFQIDVKKMPLGKISKDQIKRGFAVLEQLEGIIKHDKKGSLNDLWSQFYTIIPHDFGRAVPPIIRDAEGLQQKMDLLEVLGDIELAQGLMKKQGATEEEDDGYVDHQFDINYKKLKNPFVPLLKGTDLYKTLENYFQATKAAYPNMQLLDIFELERSGEKERFDAHKAIENRRLLWHGTNVAVCVAILSSGLRIMPHSGGRVGRGIYFASECGKSSGYVRSTYSPGDNCNIGIMFLNEVALGKEHSITQDDSSLRTAPNGYDSIIARGRTEPDPSKDVTIDGQYGPVTVPQGKPINQKEYTNSSFFQSEYLVYKESQVLMRYMLKFKWG